MNERDHDLEWNDRLQDWLDGELDLAERPRFDAHLETCSHCRTRLGRLQALDRGLREAMTPASLGDVFDARLFARIEDLDEARRAQDRARAQAEIQAQMQLLARSWRRTLAIILPSVIAGIALAFALASYFGSTDVVTMLAAEGADELGGSMMAFVRTLLTGVVGATIGYIVARWLTPAAR